MNRMNTMMVVIGSILFAVVYLFMRPTRGITRLMGKSMGRAMTRRMMKRLQLT